MAVDNAVELNEAVDLKIGNCGISLPGWGCRLTVRHAVIFPEEPSPQPVHAPTLLFLQRKAVMEPYWA